MMKIDLLSGFLVCGDGNDFATITWDGFSLSWTQFENQCRQICCMNDGCVGITAKESDSNCVLKTEVNLISTDAGVCYVRNLAVPSSNPTAFPSASAKDVILIILS